MHNYRLHILIHLESLADQQHRGNVVMMSAIVVFVTDVFSKPAMMIL